MVDDKRSHFAGSKLEKIESWLFTLIIKFPLTPFSTEVFW